MASRSAASAAGSSGWTAMAEAPSPGTAERSLRGWAAVKGRSVAVAPPADLFGKSRMGRTPIELGPSLGRVEALVEQEYLREVVAQAGASLLVGTRDRPWSADCHCGRLRQLGNGFVQTIANEVPAPSGLLFHDPPQ